MYVGNALLIVPQGNAGRARAGERTICVKADGLASPAETGRSSDLVDIRDSRLRDFLKSGDAEASLGKGWQTPQPLDSALSPDCRQWVHVEPDSKTVTIQSEGLNFKESHWIQAQYDPRSGRVNPKTIVELYTAE
jgi:hypothetical protein